MPPLLTRTKNVRGPFRIEFMMLIPNRPERLRLQRRKSRAGIDTEGCESLFHRRDPPLEVLDNQRIETMGDKLAVTVIATGHERDWAFPRRCDAQIVRAEGVEQLVLSAEHQIQVSDLLKVFQLHHSRASLPFG